MNIVLYVFFLTNIYGAGRGDLGSSSRISTKRSSNLNIRAANKLVGLLYVGGKRVCSVTLLEEQLIATNNHCVCKYSNRKIEVRFPSHSRRNQKVEAELLRKEVKCTNDPSKDFELLRLKKPVDGPRSLTRGKSNDVEIQGFPVPEDSKGKKIPGEGSYFLEKCAVYNPVQESEKISGVVMTTCVAPQGTSGGPCLRNGKVIGIISTVVAQKYTLCTKLPPLGMGE